MQNATPFIDIKALQATELLAEQHQITPKQERVLLYLITLHNRYKGDVRPAVETIAHRSRCCVRTVQRAIARFVELGLLSVRHRFRRIRDMAWQLSNRYRFSNRVTKCLPLKKKTNDNALLSLSDVRKNPSLIKTRSVEQEVSRDIWLMYWQDTDPTATRPLKVWQQLFENSIENNPDSFYSPDHPWSVKARADLA